MAAKNWDAAAGLFSSAQNWSPNEVPAAGDSLYVPSGTAILFNSTFGAPDTPSGIGLTSGSASQPSQLVAWDAALEDVTLDNSPPLYSGPASGRPADDFTGRHGVLVVGGEVTNDGGTIEAGRGNLLLPGNSLDIVVAPYSTLINKGSVGATPGNTMAISGYDGSALENDGQVFAAGGAVTVGVDLTGVGSVSLSKGPPGFGSSVEVQAAVDAGQTFDLGLGTGLRIDQPMSFLGSVSLGDGQVALEGLQAQSWDENGSAIDFFDGSGGLIDTLRLAAPQDPSSLKVAVAPDPTYGSAVLVGAGPLFSPPASATLLPYHTATAAA